MFANPLNDVPPTTGGSFVFTGGRIRTPEPLRDRVLSPPRMCECSAPLTWPHPFSMPEGLATPALFLGRGRALRTAASASSQHLTLRVRKPISNYPNTITEATIAARQEQTWWAWSMSEQDYSMTIVVTVERTPGSRLIFHVMTSFNPSIESASTFAIMS